MRMSAISSELRQAMLKKMVLIRSFEEKIVELAKERGRVIGMQILAIGQEAVAVGVVTALQPADVIVSNHRSHGHLLAKGLLLSAIFDPNPVIVIEELSLFWSKGEVEAGDYRVPLGKARLVATGGDCTVVAYGGAVATAEKAAAELATESIAAEVIDLRSLVPLDREAVLQSVRKTGRLVVVHDANKFGGFGAEIAALVAEEAFGALKAPILRVAAPDIPVPLSPPQERFNKPSPEMVAAAVRSVMRTA